MLTHLVFFKTKATPEATSGENAQKLVALLNNLEGKIPGLLAVSAGTDISCGPASWDVGLVTRFANHEDLELYRVHPEHVKVVEFVQQVTCDRAVVDFEHD